MEDPTSSVIAMLLQYLILFCIFLSSADIIADSVIDSSTTINFIPRLRLSIGIKYCGGIFICCFLHGIYSKTF